MDHALQNVDVDKLRCSGTSNLFFEHVQKAEQLVAVLELYLYWEPLHHSNLKLCHDLHQLLEIVVDYGDLSRSRFDKMIEQIYNLSAVKLFAKSEVSFCDFLEDR